MKRLRRRTLINPALQLKFVVVFLCSASVAVLLQGLLLLRTLTAVADRLPNEGHLILDELPGVVARNLLLTFALLVPIMYAVGIFATFRVMGPIHRIQEHLRRVAKGEKPGPCQLRSGDELHELCELVNTVVGPMQETSETDEQGDAERSAA